MNRRRFDKEFKVAAVKLVLEDELAVKEVAAQLDVHHNSLYRWVAEYERYGTSAFPGNGSRIYDYQAQINLLMRRNRELEEELELLKKFRAFLRRRSR